MGQRFQIIIKTPKEYCNENNPNNKEGGIYIFHCQWLYGYYSIWRMGNLIKGIKALIKKDQEFNKKHGFNLIHYCDLINKAIKWVCFKDINNQANIYSYYSGNNQLGYHDDINYKFEHSKTWLELINKFDNNNGVLFIEIMKDHKFKYAFINPLDNEGSNYNQLLDYKTYLKDYESEKEDFSNDPEYKASVKEFEKCILLLKIQILYG